MVSAAAVALALGIGVNATVFTLVSAVLIIAPVLRGRALELLDDQGQVRSCINVEPNGEVVLRLLDRNGTIRVKLGASETGSSLVLLDETTEPGVHILAGRAGSLTFMAGAFLVSRLMQQALVEVDSTNPLIYLAVAVMLLAVAEFASWLPARRATRIDPVIALRNE